MTLIAEMLRRRPLARPRAWRAARLPWFGHPSPMGLVAPQEYEAFLRALLCERRVSRAMHPDGPVDHLTQHEFEVLMSTTSQTNTSLPRVASHGSAQAAARTTSPS